MSQRYLCLSCWRQPTVEETIWRPDPPVSPAPAPVAAAAAPPVMVAAVAPPPPAQAVARHWLQDPNAPAAVAAPVTASAPVAAAPVAAAPGKKLRGLLDSMLGEGDDDQDFFGGEKKSRAEQGQLFCPCGASLGSNALLEGKASLLGFAGARSAGKTVLLLSAIHQLDRAAAVGGQEISLLGVGDTEERLRGLRRRFFVDRQKPDATVPEEETSPAGANNSYCWKLRTSSLPSPTPGSLSAVAAASAEAARADARERARKGGTAQLFGIFDVAGESWRDLKRQGNGRLLRYLDLLGLLVFVVDGAALADDLGFDSRDAWNDGGPRGDLGAADLQIFSALCERLGDRTREIALAIVISKADLLWQAERFSELGPDSALAEGERQELISRLLKESYRGSLLPEARERFRRVGLFAASGLGFRPAADDVGQDRSLVRQPRPHGVLEPLYFLLEDSLPRRKA